MGSLLEQLNEAREIFVVSDSAGATWLPKIEKLNSEAVIFWYNPGGESGSETGLTVIEERDSMERMVSRLSAMAKRGPVVVYIDMHMRSVRYLIPMLRDESIEVFPIRGRIASQ